MDQRRNLHHRSSRVHLAECLSVRPPDGFPLTDIGYEHAGSDDVLETRAKLPQRVRDDLDTTLRLGIGIADGEHGTVARDRGRSRYGDMRPDPHGPAITDPGLPGSAGINLLPNYRIHFIKP